jgi:hypothetical protein
MMHGHLIGASTGVSTPKRTQTHRHRYVSDPGRWYGFFLNNSVFSLYQSFIAGKGVLLPKAACGSC